MIQWKKKEFKTMIKECNKQHKWILTFNVILMTKVNKYF